MISSRSNDRPTGKVVHLKEERTDNTLDLASFVNIASFLSDNIKFVKEQYTWRRSREVEHSP